MESGGLTMTKQTRFNVGYAIAAIFGVFLIQYVISAAGQIAPILWVPKIRFV
jgi:hypothetical protein